MRSAITLGVGILIAVATPGLRAQANPSTPTSVKSPPGGAGKPAPQAAKPAAPAPGIPAPQAAKPAGKPKGKPAAKPAAKATAKKSPGKRTAKAVEKPATPGSRPAAESEVRQARRDPFESLLGRQGSKTAGPLPPGIRGLQVSTLRLDGLVKAPNGMIAVVSNPQARTYFLREGDHLFDGSVEKISMDGVSFHEEGKDAFGKPVERQVNKRIYSTPGELQ